MYHVLSKGLGGVRAKTYRENFSKPFAYARKIKKIPNQKPLRPT